MKPLEVVGVLVGIAGLGVGAYALLRRPKLSPPPLVAANGYGAPPPYSAPPAPGPAANVGAQVTQVVGGVTAAIAGASDIINSLGDLFASF